MNVGGVYKTFGYHEKALEYFEKALLIEPNNLISMQFVAQQHREMGNFDESLSIINEMLTLCSLPEDYKDVYSIVTDIPDTEEEPKDDTTPPPPQVSEENIFYAGTRRSDN